MGDNWGGIGGTPNLDWSGYASAAGELGRGLGSAARTIDNVVKMGKKGMDWSRNIRSKWTGGTGLFGNVFSPGPGTSRYFRPERSFCNINKLCKDVNEIRKNTEIKYHQITVNEATSGYSGEWTFKMLNGIGQGHAATAREGDKIVCKSFSTRLLLSGNNAGDMWRIALIYDRRPDGSLPSITDVFTTNSIYGIIKISDATNRGRFQIMEDHIINDNTGQMCIDKIFRKLNHRTIYKNTGPMISDIAKGSLYLAFSYQNSNGTSTGVFVSNGVLRYVDI